MLRRYFTTGIISLALIAVIMSPSFCHSQVFKLDKENSELSVSGTSSLHDWNTNAELQTGELEFLDIERGELKSIVFSVESESLKSGKTGMDKSTYKALNTARFQSIDFKFTSNTRIIKNSEFNFQIIGKGVLIICGVTKEVSMIFNLEINNETVLLMGKHTILMTDFGIEPPKAFFGAIKVGNEIEITFKSVFKR